ncbi:hypothetical protein BSKO_03663 [Bryopsis sp. KO-2023]|nr:hypothetical protein BSKO_03663 [Bryopsis sp. KO-2023]
MLDVGAMDWRSKVGPEKAEDDVFYSYLEKRALQDKENAGSLHFSTALASATDVSQAIAQLDCDIRAAEGRVEELRGDLEETENDRGRLGHVLDLRIRVMELRKQDLSREREAVDALEVKNRTLLNRLGPAIQSYEKNLGLRFEAKGDVLLLIFTLIDPKSPRREFKVGLNLQGNDQYNVCFCDPQIPALGDLKRCLMLSENLQDFVVSIRKEFRKLIL